MENAKKPKSPKVTMFRSSDGILHATSALHAIHEAKLSLAPKVKELLENTCLDLPEDGSTPFPDTKTASEWVSQNANALFELLAPLQPKKTRVPRKPATPTEPAPNSTPTPGATTPQETEPGATPPPDAATPTGGTGFNID